MHFDSYFRSALQMDEQDGGSSKETADKDPDPESTISSSSPGTGNSNENATVEELDENHSPFWESDSPTQKGHCRHPWHWNWNLLESD